jgi:hypothetical protein
MTRIIALTAACGFALFASASCANKTSGPTTRPLTAQERQDRALKDPFGYKPDWRGTDVGGGRDADFKKDGIQRDLGHVIMP